MKKHIFYDRVKLYLHSGKGGGGCISFQREKYIPYGLPDGGDGGDGGDVVFQVNPQLNSLAHLKYKRIFKAGNGVRGMKRRASGKKGTSVVIQVPLGSQIKTTGDTEKVIYEFNSRNDKTSFLKGGKGGKGNYHFKSATRQKPIYAQSGLPGQSAEIILELKLLADIGLVGFPNVGKSTFLNALTNSRSPTGNYSFTTTNPFLGVFQMNDYQQLLLADIPGVIEGAHQGKGLGIKFLKHIEKTSHLFYLLDSTRENPFNDLKKLQKELEFHNADLIKKRFHIIFTKVDLKRDPETLLKYFPQEIHREILFFSSVDKQGFEKLKQTLRVIYDRIKPDPSSQEAF